MAYNREADISSRLCQHLRLAIFASVLAVAGCSSTPIEVAEMSAALSAELTADADMAVEPVLLSEGFVAAVLQAVETNGGYRAIFAQEQAAFSRVGVSESVRRPQLSADASLGGLREFDAGGTTTTGLSAGISLSQLIYDGGESTSAINRSTAEALGKRAERETQANVLALQVARSWIDVWQFEQRLDLLRSRTSELESMVAQMERMAANGFADRAALDSARRQIVDVRLEETRLQTNLAEARVRFRQYFRQEPVSLSLPPETITPSVARAQALNWQTSPSLEMRAASVIAARHAVMEIEASFGPRIRLQTGVRTPLDRADPATSNLGLGFDYNVLDGGRRVHQLEAAIAQRVAAEDQLRDEQTTLEAELAADVERLAGIESSMPLVADQVRLSASEAEISRSQITTGQSTLRQLVEAEIDNYRAQDRQIAMRAERQVLLLTIAARTGELGRMIGLKTGYPAEESDEFTLASRD